MNYREAIEYLYALAPRGMQPGLERVEAVLALTGHPERACPCIHVAGTNGKGSAATSIAAVLCASGRRVGLFTSPHLHRLTERFRIDGRPVAERVLAQHVARLRRVLETPGTPPLTFFEVATVLAFELFRDAGCEVMVIEVGIGGRLDSTNVVTPLVSVITSIALDHMDRLGETIPEIAREKAGIIKARTPVIVGVRQAEALDVIRARALELGAPIFELQRDFALEPEATGTRYRARVGKDEIPRLPLPLAGAHQRANVACAVAALWAVKDRFGITGSSLRRGLARVRWPGRLELIPGAPNVLCDAAHNPHACEALAAHLASACTHYPRRVLLFGAMRDKDHPRMVALLRPHVDALVFTSAGTVRSEPAEGLAGRYGGEACAEPEAALVRARELAGPEGLVVACGSIFVMAAVRATVLGLRADPPIAL